jgi:galactose mutarotase-like enzyme
MSLDDIVISNGTLTASVRRLGAELVRLQDGNGTDYLWSGDPAWWAGFSPILFPIVGEVKDGRFTVDGRTFTMERHGFARRSTFETVLREPSHCALRLRPDATTRAQYPFEFELRLDYELTGATLSMRASVSNRGGQPMPASLGFHPAFCWPLAAGQAKMAHTIEFERPETAPVERPLDGLLSGDPRPSPVAGRRLALTDALFEDGALIFDRLESRRVVYGAASGPRLAVSFDAMPHLGIWTKPGAGYVCIEPWQGYASPRDFAGDLRDKPGIVSIAAGATRSFEMRVELLR